MDERRQMHTQTEREVSRKADRDLLQLGKKAVGPVYRPVGLADPVGRRADRENRTADRWQQITLALSFFKSYTLR